MWYLDCKFDGLGADWCGTEYVLFCYAQGNSTQFESDFLEKNEKREKKRTEMKNRQWS